MQPKESNHKAMKATITKNDVFFREVVVAPIAALPERFSLQVFSVLLSAKDSAAAQRNFEAILDRKDLLALRDLLDTVLSQ
jgi:hypothetical protein